MERRQEKTKPTSPPVRPMSPGKDFLAEKISIFEQLNERHRTFSAPLLKKSEGKTSPTKKVFSETETVTKPVTTEVPTHTSSDTFISTMVTSTSSKSEPVRDLDDAPGDTHLSAKLKFLYSEVDDQTKEWVEEVEGGVIKHKVKVTTQKFDGKVTRTSDGEESEKAEARAGATEGIPDSKDTRKEQESPVVEDEVRVVEETVPFSERKDFFQKLVDGKTTETSIISEKVVVEKKTKEDRTSVSPETPVAVEPPKGEVIEEVAPFAERVQFFRKSLEESSIMKDISEMKLTADSKGKPERPPPPLQLKSPSAKKQPPVPPPKPSPPSGTLKKSPEVSAKSSPSPSSQLSSKFDTEMQLESPQPPPRKGKQLPLKTTPDEKPVGDISPFTPDLETPKETPEMASKSDEQKMIMVTERVAEAATSLAFTLEEAEKLLISPKKGKDESAEAVQEPVESETIKKLEEEITSVLSDVEKEEKELEKTMLQEAVDEKWREVDSKIDEAFRDAQKLEAELERESAERAKFEMPKGVEESKFDTTVVDTESSEGKAVKAEIKLLVKTTELGKEAIEIRSIKEFMDTGDKKEVPKIFSGAMSPVSSPTPDKFSPTISGKESRDGVVDQIKGKQLTETAVKHGIVESDKEQVSKQVPLKSEDWEIINEVEISDVRDNLDGETPHFGLHGFCLESKEAEAEISSVEAKSKLFDPVHERMVEIVTETESDILAAPEDDVIVEDDAEKISDVQGSTEHTKIIKKTVVIDSQPLSSISYQQPSESDSSVVLVAVATDLVTDTISKAREIMYVEEYVGERGLLEDDTNLIVNINGIEVASLEEQSLSKLSPEDYLCDSSTTDHAAAKSLTNGKDIVKITLTDESVEDHAQVDKIVVDSAAEGTDKSGCFDIELAEVRTEDEAPEIEDDLLTPETETKPLLGEKLPDDVKQGASGSKTMEKNGKQVQDPTSGILKLLSSRDTETTPDEVVLSEEAVTDGAAAWSEITEYFKTEAVKKHAEMAELAELPSMSELGLASMDDGLAEQFEIEHSIQQMTETVTVPFHIDHYANIDPIFKCEHFDAKPELHSDLSPRPVSPVPSHTECIRKEAVSIDEHPDDLPHSDEATDQQPSTDGQTRSTQKVVRTVITVGPDGEKKQTTETIETSDEQTHQE